MEYIVKDYFSENAQVTMEEKVMQHIEKYVDISPEVWEYDDGLKAVRKED